MSSFLKTLIKEGKIKKVNLSDNLVDSYMLKADNSLKSGDILLKSSQFEDAVSMLYYSMYNITLALLYKYEVKCENHAGAILLLKNIDAEKSEELNNAKKERIDKQYYPDFFATKEETEKMLVEAKKFIRELKAKIMLVNNKDKIDLKKIIFPEDI